MSRFLALAFVALCACTPGAAMTPSGGGGPVAATIDINLTLHSPSASPFGTLAGYAAPMTNVAVGTSIRFTNSDGFAHTATAIATQTFPNGSPFAASAQIQSGARLSQSWTTGTLAAGASSQSLLVDAAGTYLYGCFFHYGSPMRGVIVAH